MNIDVHAHHIPPSILERLRKDGAPYGVEVAADTPEGPRLRFGKGLEPIRPILSELQDLSDRKSRLQRSKVDQQLLSTWLDIVGYNLPVEKGCKWSRMLNESMAEDLRHNSSGKTFKGIASVPLQDGNKAAEELEFAVKECGLSGVTIGTHVNGKNLYEPHLEPFWQAAERLRAPIIIHPFFVLAPERFGKYFLTHLVALPAETTLAAASLYFSGVIDRHPELKIVLCHGGGYLPYQAGRLNRGREVREDIQKETKLMARDVVKWFYYDTILFEPEILEFLVSEAGPDHVLLGSDCPFGIGDAKPTEVVEKANISGEARSQILSGNAKKLFNLE